MEQLVAAIAKNLGTIGLLIFLATIAILSTLREIARIRLDIARQRSSDLLNRRFASYGTLWSKMDELAIYSGVPFDNKVAQSLRERLSAWYFSAEGGLLLSETARDFYFGLQHILTALAGITLQPLPRDTDPRTQFLEMLKSHAAANPDCVAAQVADHPELMPGQSWFSLCKVLTDDVLTAVAKDPVSGSEFAFCVAQQVSSSLRSRLAFEIQSRLDLAPRRWWPWSRPAGM